MFDHIAQDFVDNLPPPSEGKVKAEFRAGNFPKGFRIEVRSTSNGVGTYRIRINGKDIRIGRTNEMALEEAIQKGSALLNVAAPASTTAKDTSSLTLSEFFNLHYKPNFENKLSTFKTYQGLMNNRVGSRFGNRALDSLTVYDLEQFQSDLLREGLSESHAVHHLKFVMRLLNVAVKWRFIDHNPCIGIEMIKYDNRKERYLTKAEQVKLVEAASKDGNRQAGLLIVFLLNTGMRCGAARSLQWDWVSLEDGMIVVPAKASKNRKANNIYLNDSAIEILDKVKRYPSSPYVFINPRTKKPFVNIQKAYKRILAAAGLPCSVRIHDLRHTFCHNLVSDNHSLATVKELVNHANYETTLRYAKIAPASLRRAIRSSATSQEALSGFD